MSERRDWIRKFRDETYAENSDGCPVCRVNLDQLVEEFRRERERLTGALALIAGQDNTRFGSGDDRGLSLDADDKMRRIAREALKPYPAHALAKES